MQDGSETELSFFMPAFREPGATGPFDTDNTGGSGPRDTIRDGMKGKMCSMCPIPTDRAILWLDKIVQGRIRGEKGRKMRFVICMNMLQQKSGRETDIISKLNIFIF